ncbi:hypothetical protein WDU94_000375 [Cyamophila willieti]
MERWYFTKEQLENSPSRKCGINSHTEHCLRHQAATLIENMSQSLQLSQTCVHTALVYMHRFYMCHSFTRFQPNTIAPPVLLLADKMDFDREEALLIEDLIHAAEISQSLPRITVTGQYKGQVEDIILHENLLLQTLGFNLDIEHPHKHVLKACTLIRVPEDVVLSAQFMASCSAHLTTMCLQYKPTLVACFSLYLVLKWANWEIPLSCEGRTWFTYIDDEVTEDKLVELTREFLDDFDKLPSKLKDKINAIRSRKVGRKTKLKEGKLKRKLEESVFPIS